MDITSHVKINALRDWADAFETCGLPELHVPAAGTDGQQDPDGLCIFQGPNGIDVRSITYDGVLLNFPENFDPSVQGHLRMDYLYRDENNFKQFNVAHFHGPCTAANFATILTFLTKDPLGFTPSNVGLEDLQYRWGEEPDYGGVDDHLHELQWLQFTAISTTKSDEISDFADKCRRTML